MVVVFILLLTVTLLAGIAVRYFYRASLAKTNTLGPQIIPQAVSQPRAPRPTASPAAQNRNQRFRSILLRQGQLDWSAWPQLTLTIQAATASGTPMSRSPVSDWSLTEQVGDALARPLPLRAARRVSDSPKQRLTLLIDTSLQPESPFAALQTGLTQWLSHLDLSRLEVDLISFGETPALQLQACQDPERIQSVLEALRPGGRRHFFEALELARKNRPEDGRPHLVLVISQGRALESTADRSRYLQSLMDWPVPVQVLGPQALIDQLGLHDEAAYNGLRGGIHAPAIPDQLRGVQEAYIRWQTSVQLRFETLATPDQPIIWRVRLGPEAVLETHYRPAPKADLKRPAETVLPEPVLPHLPEELSGDGVKP